MFWKEGINKKIKNLINFDVDSEEFNQLLQTRFLNLSRQGDFQPRPPPEIPPLQPHPNISGILVPPLVSLPPEIPPNDGWNEIVNPPQHQSQG